MGTLVLHIGTYKTGTTALQRFMWDNADAMAERGLFVPKPPENPAIAVDASEEDADTLAERVAALTLRRCAL